MENNDKLREGALYIAKRLEAHGYEAYFIGGCVRDLVMGRTPVDYDIVTSATPEEVNALFPHTVPVGARFGVTIVVVQGFSYEVATFRREESYQDGRHPSRVEFATLKEDVLRRDFTINGIAMRPVSQEIIDHVGGLGDIKRGVVRTIGSPYARFAEDHLRMLRAVRFASQLDFSIERETFSAIIAQASNIHRISSERIRDELTKIITRRGAKRGLEILKDTGLMKELLPEVLALEGVEQPRQFHPEGDAFTHTLRMFDFTGQEGEMDRRLAWAALLHDTGKAVTRSEINGTIHFYRHTEKGMEIADKVMERMRCSTDDRKMVLELIKQHMKFMHVRDMAPRTLKRFLRLPEFHLHLELHRLDCLASHGILDNYYYCLEAMKAITEEELRPPRIVTGKDLIAWGFTPGPLFGEILREVEDAQLDGKIATQEEARDFVLAKWRDRQG